MGKCGRDWIVVRPTHHPAHQWTSHSFIEKSWQQSKETYAKGARPSQVLPVPTARDAPQPEHLYLWHIRSHALQFVMLLFPLFNIIVVKVHLQEFKKLFFNQLIREFLILWSLYMAANLCCHEEFLAMWQIQVSVINTHPDWCCQPDDHRRWQIPSAQGRVEEHLSH